MKTLDKRNTRRSDLILENAYNINLNALYTKLFRRINYLISALEIAAGSAALGTLLGATAFLPYIGATIAILGLLVLLFNPGEKAGIGKVNTMAFGQLYVSSDQLSDEEYERELTKLQLQESPADWKWVEEIATRDCHRQHMEEKEIPAGMKKISGLGRILEPILL